MGVQFGNGEYIKDTWDSIFNKFIKVLHLNSSHNLKLKGKSVLLNCSALSKLWYVGSFFHV